MPNPDYTSAILGLQENLNTLMNPAGHVAPEDRPIWNVSNALLCVLDSLQNIDSALRRSGR